MMRLRLIFGAIAVLLSVSIAARAADPVGEAAKVDDNLTGPAGKLLTGAAVYFNDKLKTDATGVGQIIFRDGTKLAIGPNAEVTIDKFVYAGDGSFSELAVSMTKGAFRWISGSSKPEAYKLSTGWANLAVRGTAFDLNVDLEGSLTLVLYEGAVTVCLENGECQSLDGRCRFIRTETRTQVSGPKRIGRSTADDLKQSGGFPFIGNAHLLEPFRVEGSNCKIRKMQKQRKAMKAKRTKQAKRSIKSTKTQTNVAALISAAVPRSAKPGRNGTRLGSIATPGPTTSDPDPTVEGPGPTPSKPGKSSGIGNPGNSKNKGNAGESPSGGNFGDGQKGKSDTKGKSGSGHSAGKSGGKGKK